MRGISWLTGFCLLVLLSACGSSQYIQKTDDFNQRRSAIKQIVVLEPDYYQFKSSGNLYQGSYTQRKEQVMQQAFKRAADRIGINMQCITFSSGDSSIYFTALERLRSEMQTQMLNFLSGTEDKDEDGMMNVSVLSPDIYISPEYSSLSNAYSSAYFYYAMIIEKGGQMYVENVLADLEAGKVVYMEKKRVTLLAQDINIRKIVFDSLYQMLSEHA